jgi:hypothetical protein
MGYNFTPEMEPNNKTDINNTSQGKLDTPTELIRNGYIATTHRPNSQMYYDKSVTL